MNKKFLLLVALVLAAPSWAADERARTDRATKTHSLLGVDSVTGELRLLKIGPNGLLVDSSGAGSGVVDQGVAGVDPTVRWHMVLRNAAGVEFGLAASPFGVQLFDAVGAALGLPANPFAMQGDVADDAPDTGNPVKEGGVARTGLRTPVADGDRVDASYDKEGRKVTAPHAVRENEVRNEITLTNTTETEVLAAGGAGIFLDVTGILVSNTSNTTLRVLLRDVLSGTVVISPPAASGGGGSAPLMLVPLPQATANSQWTAELSSMPTGGNVKVFLQAVKRQ